MADKLIYMPNDDTQNYPFCRLILVVENWNVWNTQHNETTNRNSQKSPNLLGQRITKRYYKTLGTSVITSQSPLSLYHSGVNVSQYLY